VIDSEPNQINRGQTMGHLPDKTHIMKNPA